MSSVFHDQQAGGRAGIATMQTPLARYEFERDAATAWLKGLEATGGPTKEQWLEFSDRICVAAQRLLAESAPIA